MSKKRDKKPPRPGEAPSQRRRPAERYQPDPAAGLTLDQVAARKRQGLDNGDTGIKTKTEGQIIRDAYRRWGTTVAVARELGISQATAARKVAKYVTARP